MRRWMDSGEAVSRCWRRSLSQCSPCWRPSSCRQPVSAPAPRLAWSAEADGRSARLLRRLPRKQRPRIPPVHRSRSVGVRWRGDAADGGRDRRVPPVLCRRPGRTVYWTEWSGRPGCWRGRGVPAGRGAASDTGIRGRARGEAVAESSSP